MPRSILEDGSLKILSDFDGVLTHQISETEQVRSFFNSDLVKFSSLRPEAILELIEEAENKMDESPFRNGWKIKGRISAFCNEDFFIRNNALAACFDEWAMKGKKPYVELQQKVLKNGFSSFMDLAKDAYFKMVRETEKNVDKPLDPQTVPVFQKLLDDGHEIVVVSNSGTERILDFFSKTDLSDRFRVRGGAKKFELADRSDGFSVGSYFVETARPFYEEILLEEKPDLVIGDVFSLDLALPNRLRTQDPERFSSLKVFLREQNYTPAWVKEFFSNANDSHLKVIRSLDEVLEF